jgi:predicted amino acid-binding ACT domain protein
LTSREKLVVRVCGKDRLTIIAAVNDALRLAGKDRKFKGWCAH